MLALQLRFGLLVTQFNSLYQSSLILMAVVFSTAGVLMWLVISVRTGAQRLRPVMLTTVTTIFGLWPLAANISGTGSPRDKAAVSHAASLPTQFEQNHRRRDASARLLDERTVTPSRR